MGIKGRGQRKKQDFGIFEKRGGGGGRKKNRLGVVVEGRVKNGINRFAGASRLATLKRGWIWGM